MAITNTVNAIRSATGRHSVPTNTLTSNHFDDAEKMMADTIDMTLSTLAVPAGVTGGTHGGV